MSGTHSLRVRLLGGMLAVFALGLAASLASYRYQVNNIVKDVRGRTLEAQDQLSQSKARAATLLVSIFKALGGGWEQPE